MIDPFSPNCYRKRNRLRVAVLGQLGMGSDPPKAVRGGKFFLALGARKTLPRMLIA